MAFERITVNPDVMGGMPCMRGPRIPVARCGGDVSDGMITDEVVAEVPDLLVGDVCEALRYATGALARYPLAATSSQLVAPYTSSVTSVRFDRITVDPGVLGGKPCIRGMRISVGMIVQMVAAGKSTEQIVEEYPYLEVEDVQQSLEYSAALAENEYHLVLRPSA